jgi:hypothetical protein
VLIADLIPSGDPDVNAFVALMFAGFLVGVAGHVVKSNAMVIIGIGLVFLATVALPLIVIGGHE